MNEEETKKFSERLESIAICQALQLLIKQTEDSGPGDEGHQAMLVFFRSLLTKYKRRTGTLRIKKDDFGQVELIDDTLRTFNTN